MDIYVAVVVVFRLLSFSIFCLAGVHLFNGLSIRFGNLQVSGSSLPVRRDAQMAVDERAMTVIRGLIVIIIIALLRNFFFIQYLCKLISAGTAQMRTHARDIDGHFIYLLLGDSVIYGGACGRRKSKRRHFAM